MKRKTILATIMVAIVIVTTVFLGLSPNKEQEHQDKVEKSQEKIQYQEISTKTADSNIIAAYQKEFNNTDIIAEISIENTDLKTPVVQGSDNDYYLHHLLNKEKNDLGSVFLDYRNTITDRKILIYGHNSENIYTEFHLLENYLDPSYYPDHANIFLKTDNNIYQYQIFSVYIATTDYQHVNLNFNDTTYYKHLTWLKQQSIYETNVGIEADIEILVLQTCYFEIEDSYLIIAAKKI